MKKIALYCLLILCLIFGCCSCSEKFGSNNALPANTLATNSSIPCTSIPSSSTPNSLPANLIALPVMRQSTNYTCGVACVQSILCYNGIDYRQDNLAKALGAKENTGTSLTAIADFLNAATSKTGWWMGIGKKFDKGINAVVKTDMTIDKLHSALDQAKPVICCIQAWHGESDYDYTNEWEDGHYVIAIGYDDARVYFMDPSTPGNYTYKENSDFLECWHDCDEEKKYIHTGIIITNPNPTFHCDNVFKLE